MRLDTMKDILTDEYFNEQMKDFDESSISMQKFRSEKLWNKTIMEEIEDAEYNTHADDYQRMKDSEKWSKKKKELYDSLDNLINYHVDEIINHLFKEKELHEVFQNDDRDDAEDIWKQRFVEYTIKGIRLVKPSQRLMKDTMDVNDYISIKLIDYEDDSKCKYINGWVLK